MYSVDSSALIDGWARYYPPDVLPTLWEKVDEAINNGRLQSPEEVQFDLERGADDLHVWCCARERMFRAPSDAIQERVREIVNRFLLFVPERVPDRIWADPYVIALAQVEGFVVVTGEKRAPVSAKHPKIPNVCDALHIECIPFLEFIRREGWRF